MKLTPEKIVKDGEEIRRKYKRRDDLLLERSALRFGMYDIIVPPAYQQTCEVYKSPILDEEGRQLVSLISAKPIPHVIPPRPEFQPQTTAMEQFASASFEQLQFHYGNVDDQCASAQVHDRVGWLYFGFRRDSYSGAPKETGDVLDDALALDDYKQSEGICGAFDLRFVPTQTMYWSGPVTNPKRVWEIKWIDEFELISVYGLTQDKQGKWSKPSDNTMISGTDEYSQKSSASRLLQFVEYWDHKVCHLIAVNPLKGWIPGMGGPTQYVELDYWEHDWGRTPYFARPAFETNQISPEHCFASPLDSLYTEIKTYNRVRTIFSSIAYMTGFAPLKVTTKEGNQLILDEKGNRKKFLEFEPGKPTQLGVGQDVNPVIVSPEAQIVAQEVAAAEGRIIKYSLSDISRGVSPGADTANSSLSTLRRMQRSSLSKLNENQARQYHDMWEFLFKRIIGQEGEGLGETAYAYDDSTGDMLPLAPEDIITLNFTVKSDADAGMDRLTEEKAALEAYQVGAIAEEEYHERRGKENPEEYVRASALDRLRRSFEPEMFEGIKALFGQSSALARMIAKQRETGNAEDAIPEIMNTISGIQNPQGGNEATGVGVGSPMAPRAEGVRSPYDQQTTQPQGPYGAE